MNRFALASLPGLMAFATVHAAIIPFPLPSSFPSLAGESTADAVATTASFSATLPTGFGVVIAGGLLIFLMLRRAR
ncbi:MAG: hypothetical protein V2I43_09570 [Parvularcula sp.]|jgi:hypothetical protein|nr:hypothetical protein [Parvularcula sp.]